MDSATSASAWLKRYYFTRFVFSAVWVVAAFTIAQKIPALAAVMLVAYPAWDAAANFVDAQRDGGLARNKTQLLNFIASAITAVAVAIALTDSMHRVLVVFGIWAGLAGIFQLGTGIRRWKTQGAQWAMILSGAQSALAGIVFVKHGIAAAEPASIMTIAPYAAFGAFYFLVSATWLAVRDARKASPHTAS